jgi:hypothetical protein
LQETGRYRFAFLSRRIFASVYALPIARRDAYGIAARSIGFFVVLRTRRELGKIDFDIHTPSLCVDVNLVNSELARP